LAARLKLTSQQQHDGVAIDNVSCGISEQRAVGINTTLDSKGLLWHLPPIAFLIFQLCQNLLQRVHREVRSVHGRVCKPAKHLYQLPASYTPGFSQ
jgi:hypothetical protein